MLTQFNNSYLAGKPCERIYNSLDTTLWKPLDKVTLRARHKINPQTKILAFIAADPGKELKGMDYLLKALSMLPDPESYLLLIAGKDHPGLHALNTKFQIHHWGYLNSQERLNEFYSLGRLLVNPSSMRLWTYQCGSYGLRYSSGCLSGLYHAGAHNKSQADGWLLMYLQKVWQM